MGAWEQVGIALGGGVIGTSATAFFVWLRGSKADRIAADQKSRQDTRDEFQILFDRAQREIDRANSKIEALERKHERCEKDFGRLFRMYTRIMAWKDHFQTEMTNAKIPFRPFVEPVYENDATLEDDQ